MLARLKSLAGQSIVYGLGGLLPKAIGFLLIPLYTQYLTPADYGILAIASTIGSILVILFELGIGGAVTRFYYDYVHDPVELRRYLGSIWMFLSAFVLVCGLLLTWWGDEIFSLLFTDVPFRPYGLLTVWTSVLTTASVIPLMLYRVQERPNLYVLLTVGRFLVSTLAIIYFVAFLQQGALGSLNGQLLAGLVFLIPFIWTTLRHAQPTLKRAYLKSTIMFSLPLVPHQLSSWALTVSDRVLLERYVTMDQVGLYSLGYRLAMILDLLLMSVNMAWAPFFFRTASTEEDAPHIFARIATYFCLLILLISLPLALLSTDLLKIMARPTFLGAAQVVPIVLLAYIIHGFYYMLVNQLFYAKSTRQLPAYTLTAAGVNIVLNLVLMPRFGILAAAWNTVIGYAILTVLVFYASKRVYPVPYEYRRILVALAAALVAYIACSLIHLEQPLVNMLARTAGMLVFPLLLVAFRFFTPQEIKGIRSLPLRLRRRWQNV